MAETLYLAVTGNDVTGTGSGNHPFATLATTLSAISAHDTTIIIKDGTYAFNGTTVGVKDTTHTISTSPSRENSDEPFPRLLNLVHANLTIKAENKEKAIIDCENTNPGIWFMTDWVRPNITGTGGALGNNADVHPDDTMPNDVLIEGLVIKNYKKIYQKVQYSTAENNGGGSGLFNLSTGMGTNSIKISKCVIKDSIIQNSGGLGGSGPMQLGIVSARVQYNDSHRGSELSTNFSQPPTTSNSKGGMKVTYINTIFANIGTDASDPSSGSYYLYVLNTQGVSANPADHVNGNPASFVKPMTANIINCIHYFTKTGGAQYAYLFSHTNNIASECVNIQNNIFYNVGDPINTAVATDGLSWEEQWSAGFSVPKNIFENNIFYGTPMVGTFPLALTFSTASGNILDTDPQILSPGSDRWGLRQDSPCKGTGNTNPTIF